MKAKQHWGEFGGVRVKNQNKYQVHHNCVISLKIGNIHLLQHININGKNFACKIRVGIDTDSSRKTAIKEIELKSASSELCRFHS